MRQIQVAATCVAALLAGSVGPVGRAAAEDPSTAVDSLSATVSGDTINVSGTATFVDVPATVGTDPAGDAATPFPGTDITSATIARPVGSNTLTFTVGLRDMPPTPSGAPPGHVYRWNLSVEGIPTGLTLEAAPSLLEACGTTEAPGGPVFRIMKGTFTEIARLPGSIENNEVTFENVPLKIIGATGGSRVNVTGLGVYSMIRINIPGVACYSNSFFGDAVDEVEDYVVPGASVQLGLAPANTQESEIPLTAAATVGEDGSSFNGSLPIPAAAGNYIVVAKACYVPNVCGTKSMTLAT